MATGASRSGLTLNEWNHVAGVRANNGDAILYVNGVAEAKVTQFPGSPLVQEDYFKIGWDDVYSYWTLNGDVDEVAIFDRALNSDEIKSLYLRTANVGFRVRSGPSPAAILFNDYVGPDGTSATYYSKPLESLISAGSFNPLDRYIQYKATFLSNTNRTTTPFLDAVRVEGNTLNVLDDSPMEFSQGVFGVGVTNTPSVMDTPYVRLVKAGNGGCLTNGTFTSRVWDAGSAVTWNQILWNAGGGELPNTLSSLEGLWHMNETWSDVSGKGHIGSPGGGVGFTPSAKLGTHSAVFNGVDASVSVGSMEVPIQTVEWWMKTSATDCGIMELASTQVWFAVSNSFVWVGGNGSTGAKVYVNGGTQPALLPGWNHVAVTFPSGVSNTAVVIGSANGRYFDGAMDELVMFGRSLWLAEIKEHYFLGRRTVAGQIRFQARADNNNPPQSPFVGMSDTIGSYFTDASGVTLPGSFSGKRYFQYRAYLTSDDAASPALNSVTVKYSGTSTITDDTREKFNQGTYDDGGTAWAGDAISRVSFQTIGPLVLNPLISSQLMTLWQMDDDAWVLSSPTVRDSSGNGRNGIPVGTVILSVAAKVGVGAGSFLSSGYITASGGNLGTGDFTISLWWNSTMTGRCSLATTYAAPTTPYYAVELNPISAPAGSMAFLLSDGATVYRATSFRAGWTDGRWHHVSGVKQGGRIYLYMDGVLDASATLATANINLGAGLVSLGKYGTQNIYLTGMMDEVMTHSRALTEWEIADLAAAGYETRGQGTYLGPIMDGGQPTYWERLGWVADAPYGKEHTADPSSIVGLWHMNVVSNGVTPDDSGAGHDGTVEGGGALSASGRLGSCLSLTGAGQDMRVTDAPALSLSTLSWETWVMLTTEANAIIIDKSSGGSGIRLGTDALGRPYFQVGSTVSTAVNPLRVQQWYHVAGTYDGVYVCLYVNGRLRARVAGGGNPIAAVDAVLGGNGFFDEAALYNRALNNAEVLDHYRAGAVTLKFQVQSWAASGSPGDFIGPDGTTNTFFTDPANSLLFNVVPLNQYFQYRATFATEDAALTPLLQGVQISMSGYPSDNPWVAPATGFGSLFLGNLLNYMHVLGTNNNETEVKYWISGNNGSNWYAWGGSQWDDVTLQTNSVLSWQFANPQSVIQANIGSFYDQLYAKAGGVFKFKAFLKSDATKQISLDEVRLAYSPGRVVVSVPNGLEVGQEAWLEGVPYTVQWISTGTVGNKMKLEYSLNSGSSWSLIASNVANVAGSNSYSFWTTPASVSDLCRVRVTDMADSTISDLSDSNFSIVERFRMLAPNGGEKWYTGRTNVIRWASALNLGLLRLDYMADGADPVRAAAPANYTYNVVIGQGNTPGSASNVFSWATPQKVPGILSESGRMSVRTFSGGGFDYSDNVFTLAGIEFTNPVLGSSVKRNAPFNIQWMAAGAGSAVALDFSTDGGANWTNVVASVFNEAGSNTYAWVAAAPPTDSARLRMRSLSDTNVIGVSDVFTLADIDVTSPAAGSTWLMGTTNIVTWQSGGAGDAVNLYYSIDSGASWVTVALGVTNSSGLNSYSWKVPPFPSSKSRVKVESVADPVNLWAASPDFNIAGVRVTTPNGADIWVKGVQNYIGWEFQSIGQLCTVQFSYDGGVTYTNIGGPGIGLSDRSYVYTPTWPTVRAKAKVLADNPSPFTNVFDESDAYFTVAGITVTTPTNGVSFTIGTANSIEWTSAGSEDPLGYAKIYYSTTGTDSNLIATVGNNQAFPGGNTYSWNILPGVIPSATARIIVQSGAYTGRSDPFILRGIKFVTPDVGTVFDIGSSAGLGWVYAGIDASAVGYIYLSTDGGVTFGATPLNSTQIWPVQGGGYPWMISAGTTPTTNAVLKFRVEISSKPEDVGFEALSQPFVIRGLKVAQPNASSVWDQGTTNVISWLSSRAGSYATLTYAANGVNFDAARPIAVNRTLTDGTNTFSWPIESFRVPSTNARIRVVSSLATADSAPFTVRGIRVTTPTSSDVWAVDETNRLAWTAVGASGTYTVSLLKNGSESIPIASGVAASYFDWVVTSNAVSTNDVIVVQDSSGLRGVSDVFRVVGEPTIGMVAPAAGELLKVSDTYTVIWSKGGKMDNDFKVQFSTYPYAVTNDLFTGAADFNAVNNTYSVPWPVKDRLGSTIILIENNIQPTIRIVSAPFYVVGMFTLLSPNGGETSIYALKPTTVSWLTRGSVLAVNLYYSVDALHQTWIPITSTPIANNGGGVADQLTTYDWTAANIDSTTARIRVEQANQPGASDDSDANFSIRYYEIVWHVFDIATSNNLDKLAVTDGSGWSEGGLSSPVTHRYPYGTFDTIWSREYFYNNVVFKWAAEPSRTIDVPMKRSDVEPDLSVLANFVYDPTLASFRVNSWLQQRGKVIPTPTKCTISVFDSAGTSVAQMISTTPDANGVFWQTLPDTNTLTKGSVYFAKVEIEFSAVMYSSGITFNLRVPTDAEQAQLMMNALTNIEGIVSRVDTNLTDLATAQAIFRASAGAKLDSLTNSAEVIKAGLTNLDVKIDLLSTQAITRLDLLTNAVGVIGAGDTNNLVEMVKSLVSGGATREARILTRPTSVKWGSSLNVLYRSKEGLTASYTVKSADGASNLASGPMSGSGGIYDAALTANWGYGDFQIVCSDNAGSSDRMIIKVTVSELDDLALTMGTVSGSLARVEFTLTNLVESVSNINSIVAGTTNNINSLLINVSNMTAIVGTLGELTNMNSQVAVMTNSIAQIAGLTNLPAQMNYLTNVIVQLTPLTNMAPMLTALAPITNFAPQMNYMTNLMSQLAPMTNFATQLNYVTNIVSQLTGITNIGAQVAQMTNAVGQLTVLTNLMPQTAYLTNMVGKLGGLTNMPSQLAGLTNMPAQLASLTNLPSQMAGVTTAIGQLGSLTNLGPQVDQLTIAMAEIAGLTNLSDRMDGVVTAIGSLGSLTNLGPQVDALAGSLDKIIALTNMASQMDYVASMVGPLASLTNIGTQVDALSGSLDKIIALTNVASKVDTLTTTLNGMTNLVGQVNGLTTSLNGMTNLNGKVDALMGAIGEVAGVTNMIGTINDVMAAVNQLGALTNLEAEVAQLNAGVGTLGSLTNMQPQVASILAGMGTLGSLTNLGPQVDALNGAIGEIMALTNLASQVDGVANGVTGLESTVGTMSNTLASLNAAFLAFQTMSNSLSGVSALAPEMASISATVSNLQSSMTPMSASIAGVSSNIQTSLSPMQASLASLTGVSSNIQTSMSPMQASLASLTGGLGSASDAAGKETLFGYIYELEKNLNAVGTTAQQAVSRAGGARSQANSAAGAAARIKNAVASGQIPQMMTDLAIIRKSLEETLSQVKGIPGQMSTAELVKMVNDAATTMKAMAAGRGVATPAGAGAEAQAQAGSLTDPKAVGELLNKLAETKAMMEATKLLMDEAINKPVVVDWLEGTK
jgi:hypothetical protein